MAAPGVRKTVIVLLSLVALVLVLTWIRHIRLTMEEPSQTPVAGALQMQAVTVFPEAQPIAGFDLTDQHGNTVTRDDLEGHWTVAFLGHSGCSTRDCSALIETLAEFAVDLEKTDTPLPEFWLVSVNPDDDPAALEAYLAPMAIDIQGLTGAVRQLESLAASLKGAFSPVPNATPENGPAVEYSTHLGLIAPDATLRAIAQQPLESQTLASAYRQLIGWYEGG